MLPKDGGRTAKGQQYDALPLEDDGERPHWSQHPSSTREDVRYPSSLRKRRILFTTLVFALCMRVEVLRHVLRNEQCTVLTWEPLIPLAFACWDYWSVHRHKRYTVYDDLHVSVYDALEQNIARSPYRYLVAVGLISLGGLVAVATTRSPASTHICAASLQFHWLVPFLQRLGTILDFTIAYCVAALLHEQEGRGYRSLSIRFISVGWALLVSLVRDSYNIWNDH